MDEHLKALIEDAKYYAEMWLEEDIFSAMEEEDFERLARMFTDKHPGSEFTDEDVWYEVISEYEKEHEGGEE